MKITIISTILIVLIVFQAQAQIRKVDSTIITTKIALPQADCYDGNIAIDVEKGTSSSLSYTACFAKTT